MGPQETSMRDSDTFTPNNADGISFYLIIIDVLQDEQEEFRFWFNYKAQQWFQTQGDAFFIYIGH